MIKKKSCLVFAIAMSLILIVACGSYSVSGDEEFITEYFFGGDAWTRDSIDELASGATDVVRAEVLDSRVEFINTLLAEPHPDDDMERFYMIHTVHRIKVLEVFAGTAEPGDIIEFMQKGGRLETRELVNDRQVFLAPGYELIFFLYSFESHGFGHLPMVLESTSQAIYQVTPSIQRS